MGLREWIRSWFKPESPHALTLGERFAEWIESFDDGKPAVVHVDDMGPDYEESDPPSVPHQHSTL